MASKELRRLKRRELLKMLLVQCQETERLEKELNEITTEHETMMESYERLKVKLDVKDERLNQKDAQITELKNTIENMKSSKVIELEEAGSIAEAALRLNGVFEAAQKAAEQYLSNVRRISEIQQDMEAMPEAEEKPIYIESGWRAGIRRKGTPSGIRAMPLTEPGETKEGAGKEESGIESRSRRRTLTAVSGDLHG